MSMTQENSAGIQQLYLDALSGPEFTTQYFIYYVRKYLCACVGKAYRCRDWTERLRV